MQPAVYGSSSRPDSILVLRYNIKAINLQDNFRLKEGTVKSLVGREIKKNRASAKKRPNHGYLTRFCYFCHIWICHLAYSRTVTKDAKERKSMEYGKDYTVFFNTTAMSIY